MKNRSLSSFNTTALQYLTELLEAANHLQTALTHLCCEGKTRYGRNVRQTQRQIELLKKNTEARFGLEKKVMFPQLLESRPQFEPVTSLLEAHHEEFERYFRSFRRTFAHFQPSIPPHRFFEKLREQGIYLTHLLCHHVRAQYQLFQAVNVPLSSLERAGLHRSMNTRPQTGRKTRKDKAAAGKNKG